MPNEPPHGACEPWPHDRRFRSRGRSLLAPTRRRWPLGATERPHLRSSGSPYRAANCLRPLPLRARRACVVRTIRHRAGADTRHPRNRERCRCRRRGRQPSGRAVPSLPLRGTSLARRGHSRHRRSCRQPTATDRRSPASTTPARPRAPGAHPRLGARRARYGRDVELELDHCLADRPQWSRRRGDPTATRRPRSRLERRSRRRPSPRLARSSRAAAGRVGKNEPEPRLRRDIMSAPRTGRTPCMSALSPRIGRSLLRGRR